MLLTLSLEHSWEFLVSSALQQVDSLAVQLMASRCQGSFEGPALLPGPFILCQTPGLVPQSQISVNKPSYRK